MNTAHHRDIGPVQSCRDRLVRLNHKHLNHSVRITGLRRLGIDYAPTQANFIWIDTGKDSQWVFRELLKRGVIVRTGDIFGCPTHIRVTTATDAANERFIATLAEVLGK